MFVVNISPSICSDRIKLQETIDSRSEFGEDAKSTYSGNYSVATSFIETNTYGDISPDAL
jgi:hypothetical protein